MARKYKIGAVFLLTAALIFLLSFKYSGAQSTSSSDGNNADAIAVRVVPNPNHYSITRWYESQGVTGSPQSLIVDGYEAIRDGRTVYVNAANVDPATKNIYTNIYLISYNQDPAPNTVDILGQIISHWKFNDNLAAGSSPSTCSISSLSCASDSDCAKDQYCATSSAGALMNSCQLKTAKNCLADTDCPSSFFCDSLKAKVTRDVKRAGQLEELKEALFNYKTTNNHYPFLSSGTYLSGHSVSLWPSWSQVFLSDLAVTQNFLDPINRLGACTGYDVKTCWDEKTKKFVNNPAGNGSLILPNNSYAFVYSTDAQGSNYNLCATLETRDQTLQYSFSPNNGLNNSDCISATGVSTGGQGSNTAPQLVTTSLTGEANREFDGFIKVTDAENNPVRWSLSTSGTNWSSWSAAPTLVDTSNPNQKKVYAAKAGVPGTYNLNLTISDGLSNGTTTVAVPIKIVSALPLIEAADEEYFVDPVLPLTYDFTFSGNNINNPGLNTPVVSLVSGPFDILASLNSAPDTVKTISTISDNKYQIFYKGLVPTSHKFSSDASFKYNIKVTDKFGVVSSKDFNLKIKVTNPQLDLDCQPAVRTNDNYSCTLGTPTQGNHTISYLANGLPSGFSLSGETIQGKSASVSNGAAINVQATNEYGASTSKSFNLRINNYCGDGVKQSPNMEGAGGIYNDGYEDCDGTDGVATSTPSSNIDKQYGCMTGVGSVVPNPILTNNYCVFRSPIDGGGFCGDGYCQAQVNGKAMENCKNCPQDCGNCIATIESYPKNEQIAYFNGLRIYKTANANGVATRTLLNGNNVLGFWMHSLSTVAPNYGFVYRILVGPPNDPYDVIDTTNSLMRCASASSDTHNFSTGLSDAGYEPASELLNSGYKWTEKEFPETNAFGNATMLDYDSPMQQINITGASTTSAYLPYVWGQTTATDSTAFYCRLAYNYQLGNLGVCRPRCQNRECGPNSCGGTCGTCPGVCSSKGLCQITIHGNVTDYMTTDPLDGVTIKITNGSSVLGTTTTDSSGNYSLTVKYLAGTNTITASLEGYRDGTATYPPDNEPFDFILSSSNMAAAAARIQLSWGASPPDLDSHLKFSSYHVSYMTPSVGSPTLASLDADSTQGYGPENISIISFSSGATYKYFVHNYTANSNFTGATVDIYNGGGRKVKSYTPPANVSGSNYWYVFDMSDTGVITPRNVMRTSEP